MGKNNGFLAWIKGDRRVRWLFLAAVVGVLILALPTVFSGVNGADDGTTDIERICASVDGVGECRVLLSFGEDGESVVAVAVICEGGDSLDVRHRLTELLSSFYGIGYNRICVEKMG